MEKRPELRGEAEAGKFFQAVEEFFLQDIQRQFAVASEAIGQVHHSIPIPIVQDLARGRVAVIDDDDESFRSLRASEWSGLSARTSTRASWASGQLAPHKSTLS